MFLTIAVFILTLGILVLVHELGHYLVARWLRMGIEEFSIGFPPRIASWTSKKTGIRYALGWFPLGGYVKLAGEDKTAADEKERGAEESRWESRQLFFNRPLWQRAAVLVAGVAMNFLFAGMLLSGVSAYQTQRYVAADSADPAARLSVTAVNADGIAAKAGFLPGDVIVAIDGKDVKNQPQLKEALGASEAAARDMDVVVVRGEPRRAETLRVSFPENAERKFGIGIAAFVPREVAWYQAPLEGFREASLVTADMVAGLGRLVGQALSPSEKVEGDLAGPVGIAVLTGDAWRMGILPFLQFVAVLSLNLFLVNVLPLPALDGGRIAIAVADKLLRGRWSEQSQARVHQIGFIFLLGLIVLLTAKDVWRLIAG